MGSEEERVVFDPGADMIPILESLTHLYVAMGSRPIFGDNV